MTKFAWVVSTQINVIFFQDLTKHTNLLLLISINGVHREISLLLILILTFFHESSRRLRGGPDLETSLPPSDQMRIFRKWMSFSKARDT